MPKPLRILVIVAAVVAATFPALLAAADPVISPNYAPPPPPTQPWSHPYGVSWCPKLFNGTYGTVFFSQPQVWVSYGGACNALWGQPTWWIRADAERYTGYIRTAVNTVLSTSPQSYIQAQVDRDPSATAYIARGQFFDSQKWWTMGICFGSGCGS